VTRTQDASRLATMADFGEDAVGTDRIGEDVSRAVRRRARAVAAGARTTNARVTPRR